MKKLFISLGLALGLLASTTAQAQITQKPFVLPAAAYQVTTQAGTFTDISTAEGVVKLGADLPAKTDLKNMMIMERNNADENSPSPAFVVNAAAQRETLSEIGFPIGFDFKLSGKTMTHFVISALGGIFFSEEAGHYSYQSANTVMGENCIAVHPYLTLKGKTTPAMPGAGTNVITNKAGQPIAYYLTSGEPGSRVLTVQHHYLVTSDSASDEADRDEWIFQFKCYEGTNNIEFIVGKLEANHAIGTSPIHKMLLGFVETSTAKAADDPLGTQHMKITTEPTGLTHKLFFTQTAQASAAKGWDSITLASAGTSNQLIINGTHPQSGHTISLNYPNQCPESIEKYDEADFVITDEKLNGATFTAKIALNPSLFQNYLETLKGGTIVAVLSTDKNPKYTFENGTFYGKGTKLSDSSEVLMNTFYKFTKVTKPAEGQPNFKAGTPLTVTANNLKTSTTYYIHLYRMDYLCAEAPIYSELCHSLSFMTAMKQPKAFSAGIPTLNSVDLTATPDGSSEVIIIKTNTLKNLPDLSGLLKKGDSLTVGKDNSAIKAVVVDIISNETITVPLDENEGCYFAAYSINRTDAEAYTYSQEYLSVSVRAAYNGLPGRIDFSQFDYQIPDNIRDPAFETIHKTTFRDLPFGWTREIQVGTNQNGNTFGLGKPGYTKEFPTYLFAIATERWLDVVTPPFVCDKDNVLVTYNADIFKTSDDGIYHDKPAATDSIRLEYAIEDGEWIEGILYTGKSMPALTPEGFYPLEFTIKNEDQEIKGKRLRIRYSYYSTASSYFNVISSVNIIEGKTCEKPLAIRTVDSLMTNTAVAIVWTDNNYPPAETYTVFYKEKADETDNWKSVNSRNAAVVIPELNTMTTYTVEVAANCGKDGNSFNSYPADFTTLYGFPYSDDLTQAPDYIDANGFKRKGINPFNRGFSTATGLLSGRKDILLSMTPAEGTAVKEGSEIMLYTTSDAETGITISYNLYKKGETVPSIFQEEEGRTQHVEASSVKITIPEEMTVFARASLKGISNPSNTVKATFTIDENAPDLTLTQTPADLTPAAPLEFVANPSDASAWNAEASYTAVADNQTPRSVGLRESVKTAWLLTPRIFIEEFDMNFPLNIQFKANSAMEVEEDGKKTWVKGNIPEKYTNTKLYVLVSQNGEFSIADTIASIPVAGQTIEDQTFSFDIPGIEGQAQVALYYYNPKANPNAENDPMMLFEVYDFSFGYVGSPCFPLTNLKRSNTTTNEATFSWKGNSAEYMIYWGAASAETYTDSAMTKENTYTLTGLSDYTQYKVQVTGYCDAEHSELAPRNVTATFVTLQECHAPLNFEITDITATGATFISATDQPDFMSKRLVYVTPENGGETLILEQLADTLTVTEKFEELTAYVAQTQAICGTDSSAMSERKTFTTLEIVLDSFDLVLNVTPENAGTVTGAGRYEEGAEVTVSATAAENYDFVAWLKDTDTLSKEATYRFKMPAEALTYTALFVEKQANEDLLRAAFNVAAKNGQLLIRNLKGLTIEEVIVYGLNGKKINHFTPNSREDLMLPVDAGKALLLVRIATEQGVTVYKVYLH